MRIGVISDTHGYIDPLLNTYIQDCDQLWHAGDVGTAELIHTLTVDNDLKAVYGNIDGKEIRSMIPEYLYFNIDGLNVMIIHIAGKSPRYNDRVLEIWKEKGIPDMLVYGHSHILKVSRDKRHGGVLCINPGAVGNHGFHKTKTLIKFDIYEGSVSNMKAVELGPRAKMK